MSRHSQRLASNPRATLPNAATHESSHVLSYWRFGGVVAQRVRLHPWSHTLCRDDDGRTTMRAHLPGLWARYRRPRGDSTDARVIRAVAFHGHLHSCFGDSRVGEACGELVFCRAYILDAVSRAGCPSLACPCGAATHQLTNLIGLLCFPTRKSTSFVCPASRTWPQLAGTGQTAGIAGADVQYVLRIAEATLQLPLAGSTASATSYTDGFVLDSDERRLLHRRLCTATTS